MPDIGVSADWIRDQFIKITALCERIMTKQEDQDRRIEKIEEKVDAISDRPAKRWEGVVTAFLGALVGILAGMILSVPKV